MRTTIEIDDALLADAMVATGQATGEATLEAALRRVVDLHVRWQQRLQQQKTAFDEMAGLGWEGDLDAMREGRIF